MNSNPYFPVQDIYQKFVAVVIVLISCWLVTFPACAGSAPLEVKISLGSGQGELKFFPSQLDFIAGQKYKLILDRDATVERRVRSDRSLGMLTSSPSVIQRRGGWQARIKR